jgi:hypothetical protein
MARGEKADLVDEGRAQEDRIAQLEVPQRYEHWDHPQFFGDNIRFLCRRLSPPAGNQAVR